jgi:nicotinate-nucleotide pyrophosphorylase (carboxylating)
VNETLRDQLARFLAEDLAHGDLTSEALIAPDRRAVGTVRAGEAAVLAGIEEAHGLAGLRGLQASASAGDGDRIAADQEVLELRGTALDVLAVERTLLNIMSHMSGVATITQRAVDAVQAAFTGARSSRPPRVAATRKTLPGLRRLQKKAVVLGGGLPHRFDLGAAALAKDNHLALYPDVGAVVARLREQLGDTPLEIEVESLDDAVLAARHGADTLLLDNLDPAAIIDIGEALRTAGLRDALSLEASGGITVATVHTYADTGVDVISMGILTSAAPHIDYTLHFTP